MAPPMQDEEMPPAGMVNGAAGAPPEPEDMAEPDEPPEDTPADMAEDSAESEGGGDVARQAQDNLEKHVPPQFRSAVERLVLAGKKVMFGEQTHDMAMKEVQNAEDPATGAAMGVAALMSQLTGRAKGPVPQPAIVAAAMILLMEALQFLGEAGQVEVTPDLVSEATQELTGVLMQKLQMTPEKIAQAQEVMRRGGGQDPGMPPEEGAPPGAPPGPPEPAGAPPRGLIASTMGA